MFCKYEDAYDNHYTSGINDKKLELAFDILDNLFGRKGLEDEWGYIDEDIHDEIVDELLELIEKYDTQKT